MQLLKKLMGQDSQLPVILITGHGDVPMAVEAMRLGAFNFLEKGCCCRNFSVAGQRFTPSSRIDSLALRKRLALAPSG